uniref:Uncharacterized protein n=1 Tax=Lepeophtheirus salmonis TaxID=72036 RepID=A0A0K2VK29_LEPSM
MEGKFILEMTFSIKVITMISNFVEHGLVLNIIRRSPSPINSVYVYFVSYYKKYFNNLSSCCPWQTN